MDAKKQSKKRGSLKNCFVCGDRALGYNFNAWTCESCKAFFRRNALKTKPFNCPFNNSCSMTPVTRRFCQKCRLKKCFDIGMKKEFIMTEEEKRVKKLKKQQNHAAGGDSDDHTDVDHMNITSTSSNVVYNEPEADIYNLQTHFNAAVDEFYRMDDNQLLELSGFSQSAPDNEDGSMFGLLAHGQEPPSHGIPAAPVSTKLAEANVAMTPIRLNYDKVQSDSSDLNELEKRMLSELSDAYGFVKGNAVQSFACKWKPTLDDIVKMTDGAIRQLISLCKKVSCFQRLCQDDQIALLKGGCAPLMVLQSVMSYNAKSDCWDDGSEGCILKMDVLKQASGDLYDVHRKFIESFRPEWRKDQNIMLLLGSIALFSPERPNVVHDSSIRLQQQTFMFLLKRYLEVHCDSLCEADNYYFQLMTKLEELHTV
ncbi:Nuclear hormone receptor HR96 [Halotydeus destructor]|nr:Nuclear hormone receptor HR96 [Halotydeus destructor]